MNPQVVGVGEVLWDLLLTGPQLGGAPANFAYHARSLGARAEVITRIGNDELGREIVRRFRGMQLGQSAVQVDDTVPTGSATVELSGEGLAHFTILENVAWDHIALTTEALAIARTANAICYGSLAQRNRISRETIQSLVSSTPTSALRIFDINLRQRFYSHEVIEKSLCLANVLKLNDDELPKLAEMFTLTGAVEDQIEQFARAFDLRVVALTRGASGSSLYQAEPSRWSNCPSQPVKVVDTVGAGDSFTAALVLGLLRGLDLDAINESANEVARFVCSQAGATPTMPPGFAIRFAGQAQ